MKCERKKARYQYRKSKCKKFTTKDRKCIITRGKLSEKNGVYSNFWRIPAHVERFQCRDGYCPCLLYPMSPPAGPGSDPAQAPLLEEEKMHQHCLVCIVGSFYSYFEVTNLYIKKDLTCSLKGDDGVLQNVLFYCVSDETSLFFLFCFRWVILSSITGIGKRKCINKYIFWLHSEAMDMFTSAPMM